VWTLLVYEEGEIPRCGVYAYSSVFSWNSFGADDQAISNLRIFVALSQQMEYLTLTAAEFREHLGELLHDTDLNESNAHATSNWDYSCSSMNFSPSKWIIYSGISAIQISIAHAFLDAIPFVIWHR